MYEEGNRKINFNWGSLAIKLGIIAVIVFIICLIITKVSNKDGSGKTLFAMGDTEYITNITSMKDAAFEYFTPSKLPENIGETQKLTLAQMINQKLLIDFTNDGETCDINNSYIITPKYNSDMQVQYIFSGETGEFNDRPSNQNPNKGIIVGIYPVVYLNRDLSITGSGTENDPFKIKNPVEETSSSQNNEPSEIVSVPSTSAYASILILTLGIICLVTSILVTRITLKKNIKNQK